MVPNSDQSAYWATPPDTLSLHLDTSFQTKMKAPHSRQHHQQQQQQQQQQQHKDALQRSATIKAHNHTTAASSSSAGRSSAPSNSAPAVEHSGPRVQVLTDAGADVDEMAPRLSMSSSKSGHTEEVTTPESLHQSWPCDLESGAALAALQASSTSVAHASDRQRQQSHDSQPISIHTTEPEIHSRPPSRQLDATSAQLDRLVLQRPARLERLSSAATSITARGSTRSDEASPQTATQSPHQVQSSDIGARCYSAGAASSLAAEQVNRSPSLDTDIPSRANMTSPDSWRSLLPVHDPFFASEGQLRATHLQRSASPQSLRASPSAFDIDTYAAAKASSPQLANRDRMSTSSFDTARTSFSSNISGFSAMSMAGASRSSMQSQQSTRSDSWRSLLPADDRYHASRDVDVALLPHGLTVSRSPASPSLSDHLDSPTSFDGYNHRSAFFALDASRRPSYTVSATESDLTARRHSSFSSVEPDNSMQFAATRNMLASIRDTSGKFGSVKSTSAQLPDSDLPGARSTSSSSSSSSSRVVGARVGNHSLEPPQMTPELSQSTAADEDDSKERDSWPTSRSGRYGGRGASSPASSGPLTPEAGPMPNSSESRTAVLSQEARDVKRLASPSHISETSDSVVKATQDGLLATTTTITTKTTTTTHTQLLSSTAAAPALHKTRSEAGANAGTDGDQGADDDDDDHHQELLQSQPMKARTSSCSIVTPISPPSLPFLERRPAPPETDLVIETERTRYTLVTRLPGFSLDCITLATKQHSAHHRTLHIVADKWDAEGGGHFERRITFPDKECDLVDVKAEFDGNTLLVYVPRKVAANRFSSASSATF